MKLSKVEIVSSGDLCTKFVIDGVNAGGDCDEYRIHHCALEYPSLEMYRDGKLVAKYPIESLDCTLKECEVVTE